MLIRWRNNLTPWEEADKLVWDHLGGRDHLTMMIGAYGFESYVINYKTKGFKSPVNYYCFHVRCALLKYVDTNGTKMLLRVTESCVSESGTFLVTFDVRPAPFTLSWLLWIMNRKGDEDRTKHRSDFVPESLEKMGEDKIVAYVENVIKMTVGF